MAGEIEKLDRFLDSRGEWIKIRRTVGSANIDVDCRAFVRGYSPGELVGSITQQDSLVILSPTQINKAQWPGGQPIGSKIDARIPTLVKKDTAIIAGAQRAVQAGVGIYKDGELVRIELQVR